MAAKNSTKTASGRGPGKPFKRGQSGNPRGRQKGKKNKVTQEFRETVRLLLEENSKNVGRWLAQVAEGHGDVEADPAKALDLLSRLAEYASPKLGRTELTGKDGADLPIPTGWVIKPV